MRRTACGGRVFLLNRRANEPWNLWTDWHKVIVEPCGGGVRVISESKAHGYTHELLRNALITYL